MAVDRKDIAYLNDIQDVATTPASAVNGNIPVFGTNHALADSGKKPEDFIEQEDLDEAVREATSEIWNAVNGVYAISSYVSEAWEANHSYSVGDYCRNANSGYRCTVSHVSGASFDVTKWRLVMTPSGKSAIDAMLSSYSKDGLAKLIDLAPAYNGSRNYVVGQLAVKDSVLQICTTAGRGPLAVFSRDATIEASIAQRISILAESIPTKTSELTNDSGFITSEDLPTKVSDLANDLDFVSGSAIDSSYDTTSHGYSVGDTCTRGGKFYRCKRAVLQGAAWNAGDWDEKTLKEIASSWVTQEQVDWEEDDVSSPAYIKNKPDIPEAVVIDPTLSNEGEAADAKAVGDALGNVLTTDKLPYEIKEILPSASADPTEVPFQLSNRTVNVINATISDGKHILLKPPAVPSSTTAGVVLSRDFYVVLNVMSSSTVSVSVQRSSLKDYTGSPVSLVIPAGGTAIFRLTDYDRNSSIFLISGFGDASYSALVQIELAIDEIIKTGGSGVFTPGLFLPDEQGKYHQVSIVTDAETGEKNLGVEQRGVN